MTKTRYAVIALVFYVLSILSGLRCSAAIETGRGWDIILARFVSCMAFLVAGAVLSTKAER